MFTILSEINRKTSYIHFFNCQENNVKRFEKGTKIRNCERKSLG